ncbi:FMN-dependent dehydrogenase family protein [Ilyonectria destructans]|nr:FMN-dependent dehydrogenase family protein [Ilyonectria destructans]
MGPWICLRLQDNEAAFDRFKIRPRMLRDVSNIDPSTNLCGKKVAFPFGFPPAAAHKIGHMDGQVGMSPAAATQNTPMGLSAYATTSLEDVISVGKGNPYFMQINFLMDKEIMKSLLHRAEGLRQASIFPPFERSLIWYKVVGYDTIMLTVDAPMYGIRLNEGRNNFAKEEDPLAYDPSVTWEEAVRLMRDTTKLPIWIKGVYTAEDRSGYLDALREYAPVAKSRIALAIDSGICRGTDIFTALAIGADFCFAGRIPIWGLAWNGTEGVELSVKLLYREFQKTMGLVGVSKVKDISTAHLSVFDHKGTLTRL